MKKSIKGRKWTANSPQKTVLNEVLEDKEIVFLEKETGDMVCINFSLKKNQYAMYAEEYIPDTITPGGHKKVDITAFILDEETERGKYYLADVKSDTGGKNVIFHLCEQWRDGLKYLNHAVFCYLSENFNIEEHLMVITRNFDTERIRRQIDFERNKIQNIEENAQKMLGAAKIRAQTTTAIKKECEILERFIEKRFLYQDKSEKREYQFEVKKLNSIENDLYKCNLFIKL